MAVFLTLGPITFANYEIPEQMPFGGQQALSVKQLVGGQRVIDAMGKVDRDITWTGRFRGSTGIFRAKYLDTMRVAGTQWPLTWQTFNYTVVIKNFEPDYQQFYEIPYSITVTVLKDNTQPITTVIPVAINDAVENMITEAIDLANAIANPSVSNAIAVLSESINAIPSLSTATSQQIASINPALTNALSVTASTISVVTAGTFG